MAALQGKDLVIMADGMVIGGAKTCSINIKSESVEIASPVSARWKTYREGRMSWKVTTNYLLVDDSQYRWQVTAQGAAHNNVSVGHTCVKTDKVTVTDPAQIGLSVLQIDKTSHLVTATNTFDTYNDSTALTAMVSHLESIGNTVMIAIVSRDAIAVNADVVTALRRFGLSEVVAPFSGRYAFAFIGGVGMQGMVRINPNVGTTPAVTMKMIDTQQNTTMLVKGRLLRVGEFYDLSFSVDGYPLDRMQGNVLCTDAKITGTRGNLATGSFEFLGNGPLQ